MHNCKITFLVEKFHHCSEAYKRQEISVESLIAYLHVEENAQLRILPTKEGEGQSNINMMQKFPHGKNKGKSKVIKTPTFSKKNNNKSHLKCYTCEDPRHFSKDCLEYVGRKGKKVKSKNVNMVTMGNTEDGYGHPGFFHSDGESVPYFCSWC